MTKKLMLFAALSSIGGMAYSMSDNGQGSASAGSTQNHAGHNHEAQHTEAHATPVVESASIDLAPAPAATNAAHDPVAAAIIANFNSKVDVQETNFFFKKQTLEGGVETKRPTVTLKLPFPSVEGIIEILQAGGKQLELLQEAIKDVVIKQAREFVNADEAITQDTLPIDKLSWEAIANMPQAERRGGGIAKEVWESFAKDYIAIMPGVTGKTEDKIAMAAKVFLKKFADVKTDKKVITLLKGQLALYTTNSPNVEEYTECVEFLDKKADTLLAADSSSLLEAL